MNRGTSRRDYLKMMAATAGLATSAPFAFAQEDSTKKSAQQGGPPPGHERRIKWWHEAKFGMFIHWGLYSVIGQHEWVKEPRACRFRNTKFWPSTSSQTQRGARLGAAGQARRAEVHGDDDQASRGLLQLGHQAHRLQRDEAGPGRDLVREYVEAARAEGLRVGFYYSLMDWHIPMAQSARRTKRPAAICGLHAWADPRTLTNYGKIDILWYDVSWPLNAAQWESERMNEMVFELQPDIIVNNRNGLRAILPRRSSGSRLRRGAHGKRA